MLQRLFMERIKLELSEWEYDPEKQLGPAGGFGTVFAGSGQGHDAVAVKRFKIDAHEAAHRELNIAKQLGQREFANVVPVYDSGYDADSNSYFVIMAIAEKDLQYELKSGKTFDDLGATTILLDIANGLSEVCDIVHRDLKPANVLYHEGKWKVADFGISRFVESATSSRTLKGYLSYEYAAPEQWKFEHATTATDIYALGCIGYFLLIGHSPFCGPSAADFKQQHLSQSPPRLEGHSPKLTSLLTIMLRKAQEERPSLDRVINILKDIYREDSKGQSKIDFDNLALAGAEAAAEEAEKEAKCQIIKAELDRRKRIASDAYHMLFEIREQFFKKICEVTPSANLSGNIIGIGQARLSMIRIFTDDRFVRCVAFPRSKWDVLAAGQIYLQQKKPEYEWSASLWYSQLPTDKKYRWREVSYFGNPLVPKNRLQIKFEPFALKNIAHADEAASPVIGCYQIAEPPKTIDDESFEDFCHRWSERLAKAVMGQLSCPRVLPLK
jgi:serine/threonine-protein kinase